MLWYLLYPFRGTTDPPKLDKKHPLRAFFTRYGYNAARHPIITLMISVAVAAILIYPFPFLYTNNFTNGSSNLPHHVWTSAQPYEGRPDTRPDVIMRSIWVHGSYMKALKQDVLQSALEIQDELLGPTIDFAPRRTSNQLPRFNPFTDLTTDDRDTLHAINGLTNASWFFHSPLQYWSCSTEKIAEDNDIIGTVNKRSRQSTSVNVTLRHSIVFSGKRFEDHRLVAADALVITLIHMLDSPVGRQWERKAEELALRHSGKWQLYPSNGRSFISTLYEFRFQPLSFKDDLFLAVAYSLTALYFFVSLSKLRALKSRVGLILAVTNQIAVSIMSSFTICAIFKIDLSKIPRAVFPIVMLVIGLENIFRLINAVIMTPPESTPGVRIGEALGEVGHIALSGVAQNLVILWMLSNIGPQVANFCAFAAIAIVFDFFYLCTFFTSVLSVDVLRMELSDSLFRATTRSGSLSPELDPKERSWSLASILHMEGPFSTRIGGTLVMIGVSVIAQWHFYEDETYAQTIWRFISWLGSKSRAPGSAATSSLSVDIHQARTPNAWLRMQDHETAHEVIQVIKPLATHYIARVYDPLIFVLNGSDRTPDHSGIRPLLPAAYDFARNQFKTFMLAVIIIVAAVCLLMNYLLWDESVDDEVEREDDPLLSVKTLSKGHALDVMLLTTSRDGVLATVGLDRWIRIWDVRQGIMSYIVQDVETHVDPFPVLAIAIDNDSNWLAILSGKDQVFLWNIPEKRWGPSMQVEVKGRIPLSFCFGHDKAEFIDPVVVVRHNGLMSELHVESNENKQIQICRSPLVCVRQHFEKPNATSPNPPPRIITSSRKGCVHIASQMEGGWVSDGLEIPEPPDDKEILSILPLPILSSFLAVRKHTVDLIDIVTHRVTHTFTTKEMKKDSLRCFHSTRRRPQCGSVGLASLAIAYTCAETGNVILQSYLPQREGDTICFRDPWTPGSKTCCLWRETVEHRYEVENPGQWEALQVGYLVGIRKKESPEEANPRPPANIGIRRRGANRTSLERQNTEDEAWEVWSISARGLRATSPLFGYNEHDHLLISSLGPLQKMGKRSLAVALGNIVKIISVGHDNFDAAESSNDDTAFVGMAAASRRRRAVGARKKTF
ncbi:related to SREBP cleavage activating protein [Phialocephala subalpina]|uniref:Sterol regulatory element-binding protein cleavage-activating protein n=1 Tax=Phialocephala subalpina TaxID=576137 RepID=A0A1L7X2Z5_9HELO|nr:related to SREBP cleavage activating protein [Phialocephala subalpina]